MDVSYLKQIFSLDGKKAVVTGGSSGLGRSIALSLAAFGAEVTVTGRTLGKLEETCRLVEEKGGVCRAAVAASIPFFCHSRGFIANSSLWEEKIEIQQENRLTALCQLWHRAVFA